MSDGVLNLAGEFVASLYTLIVSDSYLEATYLYKEDAVVSRGAEGAAATVIKDLSGDISAFHQKVKAASADILAIDATQLATQQIVITVSVSFKQINLLVVQTLVLEALVNDEETEWYITSDMARYLSTPQATRERAPKSTAAKAAKPAKATAAKPVETEAPVVATETTTAPQPAAQATPVAAAAPAPAAAAAPAPVAQPKAKTERPAKKSAAPAAEKPKEPEALAAPKSWANIASTKPVAAEPTAAAAPVAKPVEKKTIHPIAVLATPATNTASTTSAGELHVFARTAKGPIDKDAAQAKFADFAPVKDIEVRVSHLIVALNTDDAEGVLAKLKAHTPFVIDGAEFTIERSRTPPRSATAGSSRAAPRRSTNRQSSSSPASKRD
jgi:hypothetical protein